MTADKNLGRVIVMGKKEKKPMSKKAKIITWSIILANVAVLVIVFFVLVFPFIKLFSQFEFRSKDTGENLVNTEMTKEQRIKDFDYMYDIVCLENPQKELIEQAYGISYDDIYNRYKDLAVNAESDYEYFSYLGNFLSVLPGCHNYMGLPDYRNNAINASFSLTEIYGTQEFKDYAYSWKEEFRDDVAKRLEWSFIGFRYVDGSYICCVPGNDKMKSRTEYEKGILLSVDGKDPKDICFDVFERYVPAYDGVNDCFFRDYFIFNDTMGEKHTGEILLPDGNIVTVDLYDDPGYDYAFLDAAKTYPELFDTDTGSSEDSSGDSSGNGTVTDVMSPDYVPTSFRVTADPEKKLVYVNTLECKSSEAPRLVSDLKAAIKEADADSIILDVRSNVGGDSDVVTDYVLPVLFSHDVEYVANVYGGRNSYTKNFYGPITYRILNRYLNHMAGFSTKGDYFYYTEDFSVKGNAEGDYKIYLLTGYSTFSSGDIMTRVCKEYDNCTVIGTNTGGEGVCGTILQCYLPESRFMFCYAPTVNTEFPEDSYLGTAPDIYMPYTVDEYLARVELFNQGTNPNGYKTRMEWDKTLQKAVEMAEND
jgi:hypothetical protein